MPSRYLPSAPMLRTPEGMRARTITEGVGPATLSIPSPETGSCSPDLRAYLKPITPAREGQLANKLAALFGSSPETPPPVSIIEGCSPMITTPDLAFPPLTPGTPPERIAQPAPAYIFKSPWSPVPRGLPKTPRTPPGLVAVPKELIPNPFPEGPSSGQNQVNPVPTSSWIQPLPCQTKTTPSLAEEDVPLLSNAESALHRVRPKKKKKRSRANKLKNKRSIIFIAPGEFIRVKRSELSNADQILHHIATANFRRTSPSV